MSEQNHCELSEAEFRSEMLEEMRRLRQAAEDKADAAQEMVREMRNVESSLSTIRFLLLIGGIAAICFSAASRANQD